MMTSTLIRSFHIAGFIYYEGVFAFKELSIGTQLTLEREGSNGYDPKAIAIYYGNKKLGYVPRADNTVLSMIMDAGHSIFTCVVQQVSADVHPAEQIRVGVYVNKV